jgi:predicted Na+-dependent transporter
MYLWSLDIERNTLWATKQYRRQIVKRYVVMMIVMPIIVYYITSSIFWNDIAIGVFLLSIAPAWIAAVSFTRLMWWNSLLSLLLAIISTLTFPFLLPFLSQYILSSGIQVDSISMLKDLILYCIVLIWLWWITQYYLPYVKNVINPHIDWVSIIMISLMIVWPVSYNASLFLDLKISFLFYTVLWLFFLSALIHLVWRYTFADTDKANKIASSLSKWFMNISIVTVVAAQYFSPTVLLIVMLYEFPWDLMLIPFKRVIDKVK